MARLGSEQELDEYTRWANFLDRKDQFAVVSSAGETCQFLDKNWSASSDTGIGSACGLPLGLATEGAEYACGLQPGLATEGVESATKIARRGVTGWWCVASLHCVGG